MLLNLSAVKVTPREKAEYYEVLSCWSKLHKFVVEENPAATKLLKMLRVESTTRRRPNLALRLLGIYHARARKENERHLIESF